MFYLFCIFKTQNEDALERDQQLWYKNNTSTTIYECYK